MQAPQAARDQSRAPSEVAMHSCGGPVKAVKIPGMIETDQHDRTPARADEHGRVTAHTDAGPATAPVVGSAPGPAVDPRADPRVDPAVDPAAVLRILIQRRQALLHRESAELRSLRTYADRLAHELLPPPSLPPDPRPA